MKIQGICNVLTSYCCYNVAKKTLSELRKLYFRMKDEVFGKSFVGVSYDTDSLEKILKEEFGEEMIMNDVTYPRYVSTMLDYT